MKKMATAFLVGLFALGALQITAARAEVLLIDYVGFDYESPNPDASQFGEVGSGYVGVGEVPGVFAPLVSDQTNFQYTYVITGLTSINKQVIGSFAIVDYSGGTLTVYEDSRGSGTPFDYGINPPNPTAPSTFNDGTAILVGNLTNFRFVISGSSGSGSFESNFDVTGGTQYGNIPASQRQGWTFAGATTNALNIPQGYAHQIDGQIFVPEPVPARTTTFGRIKSNYR